MGVHEPGDGAWAAPPTRARAARLTARATAYVHWWLGCGAALALALSTGPRHAMARHNRVRMVSMAGLLVLVSAMFAGLPSAAPVAHAAAGNAVVAVPLSNGSDACTTNTLPGNDDGSTSAVPIGFPLNFFGTTYSNLYVNNNGNVTFDSALATYTPFNLSTAHRVIIAPFFADVYTAGGGSPVTYSSPGATYGGRPAFCANWVNVGYYAAFDKLNSFQLILVDRSDVGAGDFDIIMNYNQVQWEAGDASNGTDGLGGDSARVGYSNGSTVNYEFPGSAVNGSFLDSNPNGLIYNSRSSLTPGRYVFGVRNGAAPVGGAISGTVYANSVSASNTVSGTSVQVCDSHNTCQFAPTSGSGQYTISGLAAGQYTVTAFSPGTSTLLPGTVGPVTVSGTSTVMAPDIVLTAVTPPPPGTTVNSIGTGGGGLPRVYWGSALELTTEACPGGSASYSVLQNGNAVRIGTMTEGPSGTYRGDATAFSQAPQALGDARVIITVHCPDGTTTTTPFDIHIEPSGTVRTPSGAPVPNATVTLFRSDSATGPFTQVPSGSGVLSVANRTNPVTTDSSGRFYWEAVASYYEVQASAPGCSAPGNTMQTTVQSSVLTVPGSLDSLNLQLACSGITSASGVSLATTSLSFGNVAAGTSTAQTLTLTNSGNVDLHVSSISGANGDFSSTDTCVGQAIAPGATCTITVTYAPTSVGSQSQTLSIVDDAPGGSQSIALGGTGDPSTLTFGPSYDNFSPVRLGQAATQPVTITNNSGADVAVSALSFSPATSNYALAQDTCSGQTLAAGASCTVNVIYQPTATGFSSESLVVTDGGTGTTQTMALSGAGVTSIASIRGYAAFGNQRLNTSVTQDIPLTNTGTADLHVSAIASSGADFSSTDDCIGHSIAPGAACTVHVNFTPSAQGGQSQTLSITSDASSAALVLTLTGTGAMPQVSLGATTSATFGYATVGTPVTKTLTLTNTGAIDLHVTSITGATGDFAESTTCTTAAIAPGATCTITVTFTPSSTTPQSQALSLVDDAGDSPQTIALTGTGAASNVTLNPASSYAFGQVSSGSGTATRTITVTNTSNASLTMQTVSGLSGAMSVSQNNCTGHSLTSGQSCTLVVAFTPTTDGIVSQTLRIADTDGSHNFAQSITLAGTGVTRSVALTASSADFGQQLVGTSVTQTITLTNSGSGDLHVTSIAGATGDFTASDTCIVAAVIPGSSCAITVTFAPSATGTQSATLSITDDALNSPQTIALLGMGIQPAATLSGAGVDFGDQRVGSTAGRTITVTNSGTADLHVSGIMGASGDVTTTDTCVGVAVAPGQTCTVDVDFTPTSTGSQGTTITLVDDASTSPQTFAVTGNGVASVVSHIVTSVQFGDVPLGTSGIQEVTITNSGTADLNISAITGTSGAFNVASTCLSAPVAPNGTCVIAVVFAPTATGAQSQTLTLTDDAQDSPQTITLTGTGTAPVFSPNVSSVQFGDQRMGTSATRQLIITNSGTADLHITRITGATGPFSSDNTCAGETIAPTQSCTITVTYAPTAAGVHAQSLSIEDDASAQPQTVALLGTATASAVSFGAAQVSFGPQAMHTTVVQVLTITNSGTADLHITAISVVGKDFIASRTCTASAVVPGDTCQLSIAFTPSLAGARAGMLTLTDDASDHTQTLALSGTGTAPAISLSGVDTGAGGIGSGSLSFGTKQVGSRTVQNITVTNTGTADLHIGSIAIEDGVGSGLGELRLNGQMVSPLAMGRHATAPATSFARMLAVTTFQIRTDECTGQTLAPSASCGVSVSFTPISEGNTTATLRINSDALEGAFTIPLQGVGMRAQLANGTAHGTIPAQGQQSQGGFGSVAPAVLGGGCSGVALIVALGALVLWRRRRRDEEEGQVA